MTTQNADTRYNLTEESGRKRFEEMCRSSLREAYGAADDTYNMNALLTGSLDSYFEASIADGMLYNSPEFSGQPLAAVSDTARKLFDTVNRNVAANCANDVEQLLHVARTQAIAQERSGTWSTDVKTGRGDDITVSLSIEVVRWPEGGGNLEAKVDELTFDPTPDVEITPGGDYFLSGDLEAALLDADSNITEALQLHDIDYDDLDCYVEYVVFQKETCIDIGAIWLHEGEEERLINALAEA